MAKKDLHNILVELEQRLLKNSQAYRTAVSDTKSHFIIIDRKDLKKQVSQQLLLTGGFKTLPKSIQNIIDGEVDVMFEYFTRVLNPSNFEGGRRAYYTSDYKVTSNRLTVMLAVKDGKGTRKVFQYFRRIKQNAQKSLVIALNKQIKILNNSKRNNFNEVDPTSFINVGHSEGSAVSTQRKAQVQKALFMFSSKGDPSVSKFIKDLEGNIGLSVHKRPGKQRDHIEVTLESDFLNKAKGRGQEKEEAGYLNESILKIVEELELEDLKGSRSSMEHREDLIINSFAELDKLPRVRSNVKKRNTKRSTTSASTNRKSKSSKGKPFKDTTAASRVKFGGNESRKQSNITLFALLQNQLPRTVAGKMGYPRLENRTGTFASSVRVTDVSQTKQGFASVGYTYQKDPYQVFEASSGSRFSSVERDPRTIIDASIRQIAAQLITTRLYTRRV